MKYLIIPCAILSCMTYLNAQTGTFVDSRDEKVYKTIQIGSQIWMAEDLATKAVKYSCGFKDDSVECAKNGVGYEWEVTKNACPVGWHLPSEEDFQKLLSAVGKDQSQQYGILVNQEFDALRGGRNKGNYFWTSTSFKHSAVTINFPIHWRRISFTRRDKSELNSIRCLKDGG